MEEKDHAATNYTPIPNIFECTFAVVQPIGYGGSRPELKFLTPLPQICTVIRAGKVQFQERLNNLLKFPLNTSTGMWPLCKSWKAEIYDWPPCRSKNLGARIGVVFLIVKGRFIWIFQMIVGRNFEESVSALWELSCILISFNAVDVKHNSLKSARKVWSRFW